MNDDSDNSDEDRRDRVPESVKETFQGESLTDRLGDIDSDASEADAEDEDATLTLNVESMGLGDLEETSVQEIPHIVVVAGPEVGEIVPLHDQRVVFGRSEDADVQVHDPAVSREHAAFESIPSGVQVEDLNSSNGTFVEGDRVTGVQELRDGDKIRIGSTSLLKFTKRQPVESQEDSDPDVYQSAFYDDLTGALNKKGILESLDSQLEFGAEMEVDLAVVMLDLDHFKAINDEYGHLAGDAILRQLGDLVENNTRATDVFGRFGGEEFVLLCRDMSLGDGRGFGERLRQTVSDHEFRYDGTPIQVTTSVGVTAVHPDDESADSVIDRADRALYLAKENGRNCTETVAP